jgi:hypothetical protein
MKKDVLFYGGKTFSFAHLADIDSIVAGILWFWIGETAIALRTVIVGLDKLILLTGH